MSLVCSECKKTLTVDHFSLKTGSKRGYHYKCKNCHNDYVRSKWYPKNSHKQKLSSSKWKKKNKTRFLASRYKCDKNYIELLLAHGKCQICETDSDLNIDHCHATKLVRGILCGNCNKALGLFKDDVLRMSSAISYLKKEKNILL